MLKIRLQRIGKRGQAYFRVVVTEHTKKPQGKYLELLGSYDPHKNEMNVDAEKVKHWLSQGAKMSPTVNNLLVSRGVIGGEKVKVWKPKKKATTANEAKQASIPSPQTETKEAEVKNEVKEEKTEESVVEIPPLRQTGLEAGQAPKEKEEEEIEEPILAPVETPAT